MTRPSTITGRLKGGFFRTARSLRDGVTVTDTFYTILGALIGAGVGVLFAAMWIR